MFSESRLYFPPKCPICKELISLKLIESLLTTSLDRDRLEQLYVMHSIENSVLTDKQCLIRCPFCSYVEIHENNNMTIYLDCKAIQCGKRSCIGCCKEVPLFPAMSSSYALNSLGKGKPINLNTDDHSTCQKWRHLKNKIEAAIKEGLMTSCPRCHVSGIKDGACTHITCPKCSQVYCYICELPLEQLDCELGNRSSIYHHNTNWKNNIKRCPMYLMNIHEVDKRWPRTNDTECLEYFHKNKSMKLLRNILAKETKQDIATLESHFHIFEKNGFRVEEIMKCKEILIKGASDKRCAVM